MCDLKYIILVIIIPKLRFYYENIAVQIQILNIVFVFKKTTPAISGLLLGSV
jgi:hypothetical protein